MKSAPTSSASEATGGGSILLISSIQALRGDLLAQDAYGATKGAIRSLSKSLAIQFAADNIRCNAILPGRIHTPFVDGFIAENYPDNQAEMFRKLSEYQPIGRMGTPAEVGAMAVFLCSDEASFITGAPFPVDGGTLYVR